MGEPKDIIGRVSDALFKAALIWFIASMAVDVMLYLAFDIKAVYFSVAAYSIFAFIIIAGTVLSNTKL